MPVWDVHRSELLRQCIGLPLRDLKGEAFHFEGVRNPGVSRLFLDFGQWLSVFDDAGAWFIAERSPEERQVISDEGVRVQWTTLGMGAMDPALTAFIGKRLQRISITADREELQLVFEGEGKIVLSSGRMAEGGGLDEGLVVTVRT